MLFATSEGREKVEASPGGRGVCPGCGASVIAKCGEILSWHWAHESGADCDPWYEGETPWHVRWKKFVRPSMAEVVIGPHRADMVGPGGVVCELQHSPISPAEIREREHFYGNMIWLIDAREFSDNVRFRDRGDYHSFRWRWPRKSYWHFTRPQFWQIRDGRLFRVEKVHAATPCGGWGRFVPFDVFVWDYFGARRKTQAEREASRKEAVQ